MDENNIKVGICKLCEACNKYKAIKMIKSNTSGIIRHLEGTHKEEYDKFVLKNSKK